MANLILPYDPSGLAETNLVEDELRSVQPPESVDQPSFIILRGSPFFKESLSIYTGPNKTGVKLIEGVDYYLTHEFIAGANFLGKPLYGGIAFTNSLYNGNVYSHYQSLGGDFTINDSVALEELTRRYYGDIRIVSWDQLEGVPSAFPPDAHEHHVGEIVTLEDIRSALLTIAANLVSSGSGGSGSDAGTQALARITAHLLATTDAHSPSAVGLGNVKNYPIATFRDSVENRNDRYTTPQVVTYMFTRLTEELNPAAMQQQIDEMAVSIDTLSRSIRSIATQIENINIAISDIRETINTIQLSIENLVTNVAETSNTANIALATAQEARGIASTTDANVQLLIERTNKSIYADNGFIPPGSHRVIIPPNTAVRVEMIGGGGGSGKWYSLVSDYATTGMSVSSGEDSILWYLGSSKVPLEPIPLLIAGGGAGGSNSHANIGRSAGGAGGLTRRFKTDSIYLSEIDVNTMILEDDLVYGPSATNGRTGHEGDTSNSGAAIEGVGGFYINSSGDSYRQLYGRGCSGITRAGTGGSAGCWHIILRNDLDEDAIIVLDIGKGGRSARSSMADGVARPIADTINTGGVGLLTLVD